MGGAMRVFVMNWFYVEGFAPLLYSDWSVVREW